MVLMAIFLISCPQTVSAVYVPVLLYFADNVDAVDGSMWGLDHFLSGECLIQPYWIYCKIGCESLWELCAPVVMNYVISTDGELFVTLLQSCLTIWFDESSGCECLSQRHKSSVQPNVNTKLYSNHTDSGCACVDTPGMSNLMQVLYHPQNVNFIWTLNCIHHLLTIISGLVYIRL